MCTSVHYCKVDALACFLSAFISKALSQIAREEEGEIDRIVFDIPPVEWLDNRILWGLEPPIIARHQLGRRVDER